ncbi:UNVERIFIED_CONTAM: Annexin D4 [Sesamum radiatum]|uniref:Annexin D4 n=1 Tax=Sesamum radiatum TaxID=300843 RepID=A0AAW2VHD2_SESRA
MAASDDVGSLARAFSGLGVDEQALISILGKWHPEQRQHFRKGTRDFFIQDERQFERWNDRHILQLRHEFLRLKLLVAVLSSYRYEGPKVNEETAKLEAKTLSDVIGKKGLNTKDEDVVIRILSTRSKLHLKVIYKHYKAITGNYLDEVLDESLRYNADEISKEALSRVIVTRADTDMKQIKEEYHGKYGVSLPKKIEEVANGNYRDFLLTLIARSGE